MFDIIDIRTGVITLSDKTYIYALCEPGTDVYRYVGRAKNTNLRLIGHLSEARTTLGLPSKRCQWIKSLLEIGKKPELKILQETTFEESFQLELHWIEKLKAEGYKLTNGQLPHPKGIIPLVY